MAVTPEFFKQYEQLVGEGNPLQRYLIIQNLDKRVPLKMCTLPDWKTQRHPWEAYHASTYGMITTLQVRPKLVHAKKEAQ